MNPKREMLALAAMCLVVVLLALGGLVWYFTRGLSLGGMDGLMVLLISLMMGGVFSLQLFFLVKRAGLLGSVKFLRRKTAVGAPVHSSVEEPK